LRVSRELEAGDYNKAFRYLNLNVYPVILLTIRHLGLDAVRGAIGWDVLAASLAVLPLYGLARRMFGRRIGILTGILYAVHPRLIVYSCYVLREPTQWVLFLLTLYFIWRAVTEVRAWLFVAAGCVLALAVHTRSEAWLLLVPLIGWTGWRWRKDVGQRWRLLAGTAVCLAIIPASIVLVNVTLLQGHSRWEWGCARHVKEACRWASSRAPSATEAADKPVGPSSAAAKADGPEVLHLPTATALRKVLVRFSKVFHFVYGVLALLGLWALRRHLLSAWWLPLPIMAAVVLVGITIRMTIAETDPRYYLTAVLVLLPLPAAGLLWVSGWMARLVGWALPGREPLAALAAGACILVIIIIGVADGLRLGRLFSQLWREHAVLGTWIADRLGPSARIADSSRSGHLVAYYARGHCTNLRVQQEQNGPFMCCWIRRNRPDVILLWGQETRGWPWHVQKLVFDRHESLGYVRVPARRVPVECRDVIVLFHRGSEKSAVNKNTSVTHPGASNHAPAHLHPDGNATPAAPPLGTHGSPG